MTTVRMSLSLPIRNRWKSRAPAGVFKSDRVCQDPPTTSGPVQPRHGTAGPAPRRSEGAAAEAIAGAEAALAHQNSASSQLDLQVISAIMNAHLKTVEGADALSALQREIEAAVQESSRAVLPVSSG